MSACIKNPCEGIFCSAQGECINGTCFCEEGYTGENCVSFANYFSGEYLVHSNCADTLYETRLSVYRGTIDTILMDNLLNADHNWSLVVNVVNDSTLKSIERESVFEDTINNIIYSINQPITIVGKPTDTLTTTILYKINNTDSTCVEMYVKKP